MPLKLNLGLSKKVGEPHYGSRGASINLEVEIDSALVAEPLKFQERVRRLYRLVRASLAEELNGKPAPAAPPATNGTVPPTPSPRPATALQLKAIARIAERCGVDLSQFLERRLGAHDTNGLTLQQASQVIDELRALVPQTA